MSTVVKHFIIITCWLCDICFINPCSCCRCEILFNWVKNEMYCIPFDNAEKKMSLRPTRINFRSFSHDTIM